jgi:hypothetical protein
MKKAVFPTLMLIALALGLCSCQSTNPTAGDMDRYYKEAEARAERQIARYGRLRDEGNITSDEYEEKVKKVHEEIGKNAMEIAWTRHENTEAVLRALSVPTGDHPVSIEPPGIGGGVDTFYRAAGAEGPGYMGMGAGMWHGYQPGSTIDAINGAIGSGPGMGGGTGGAVPNGLP